MESLRVTAAESLLAAAKDGSLEKALETVKQETRASRRGCRAMSKAMVCFDRSDETVSVSCACVDDVDVCVFHLRSGTDSA